jgi:alanine racemase
MNGPVARIDAGAVAHNLRRLREDLGGPPPCIWAVAKADAYGHGLRHVLPGLVHADGLAVLSIEEAHRCRALGWRKPLLVMSSPCVAADLGDPALHPLHLVVDAICQVGELERLPPGSPAPFAWLRHDGDLNHAGLHGSDYVAAFGRLSRLAQAGRLAGAGHLQHYAQAEVAQRLRSERRAFEPLFDGLPGPRCTENSAALLSDPAYGRRTDWVRSGIALYGISPLADLTGPDLGLRPAMTLQAPIYAVRQLAAGRPLGYGAVFQASRDMRVGLVRCGYGDGYPRGLSGSCTVLVEGRPCRIIGRVSMDTITIDLDTHPDTGPGAMATLWGEPGCLIEAVARCAGTIPAELCTGLTALVPRLPADRTGPAQTP